jgi:hypothetical protein
MSANARGKDPWPCRSLVPRRRGRAPQGRHLSAEERAAIEARLRSEGKLDPVPAVNAPRGDNDAKLTPRGEPGPLLGFPFAPRQGAALANK